MNRVTAICPKCCKTRTFSTEGKEFKFRCCGQDLIASQLVDEDGNHIKEPAPAPAVKPVVDMDAIRAAATK